MTACGANEVIKVSDVYPEAGHEDKFRRKFDQARCGYFLSLQNANQDYHNITIPLKIDLRRFLPLSNIKYLPSFAGKLELKVMFGTQGLVWCPVGIHDDLVHDPVNFIQFNINPITNEFTQIGDPATIWNSNNGAENLTTAQITLTVDRNYEIVDSYSVIPNFGIFIFKTNMFITLLLRASTVEL